MGWPIVRRGPGGSAMYVETKWDAGLGLEVPVRIVCGTCGAAGALSTLQAVLVAHEQAAAHDPAYRHEDGESVMDPAVRGVQTESSLPHHPEPPRKGERRA